MTSNFNTNLSTTALLLSIASLASLANAGSASAASLLGDQITIDVTSGTPFSTTATVIDPGVEAIQSLTNGANTGSIAFDFAASSFSVTFTNSLTSSSSVTFMARTFVFDNLDFSPAGAIGGVTFTGGTGIFTGVSFTNNSITLNTPLSSSVDPGNSLTLNFNIETQPVGTPEPSGVLGLLALGLGSVIQREISR